MTNEMNNNPESFDPEEELNSLAEGDIIEMIGDDGETVSFIFVDALEYEGDVYLALAEPEEDDAVFFLKVEQDEEGNDVYNAPDEELEDVLFKKGQFRGLLKSVVTLYICYILRTDPCFCRQSKELINSVLA